MKQSENSKRWLGTPKPVGRHSSLCKSEDASRRDADGPARHMRRTLQSMCLMGQSYASPEAAEVSVEPPAADTLICDFEVFNLVPKNATAAAVDCGKGPAARLSRIGGC